jgi:hypothetical protein
MELSQSIHKDVMKTKTGGVTHELEIKKRRDTFFFDDITLTYLKRCEDGGHGEALRKLGEYWGSMFLDRLLPPKAEDMPPVVFFNNVLGNIFKTMGYLDELSFSQDEKALKLETKNERTVAAIGINNFSIGFYIGALDVLFKHRVEYVDASQEGNKCLYSFRLTDGAFQVNARTKDEYDRLNYLPDVRGFTLKDALVSGTFQMKENKIYFRGKSIGGIENTQFHVLSNGKIMIDSVPEIAYEYFKNVTKEDATQEERLVLLKTLLQTLGWGVVTTVFKDNEITIEIHNPPHGLQLDKDNWDFVVMTILGYLWLIDKNILLKKQEYKENKLRLFFSS